MTLKEKYENRTPIGYYCMCNFGGIVFFSPDNDEDCDLIVAYHNGQEYSKFTKHIIHHTANYRSFIVKGKSRVYLDEVMRRTTI